MNIKNSSFIKAIVTIFFIAVFVMFLQKYNKRNIGVTSKDINLSKLQGMKNIIPVAIIGSGPSGLSSALYSSRAALHTVVFQGNKPGGQLTETTYVENWPGTKRMLGSELIDQFSNQAEKVNAIMVNDSVVSVDLNVWPFKLKTEEGHELNAMSVIIATGSTPQTLGVPGEQQYWGNGVTTCAVCDAPFYKDKDVVIVGGGDSAVEEATLLASYAKSVKMLVRSDAMRASAAMQSRIKEFPNIEVWYNRSITKILGDDTLVKEIELKNNKDKSTVVVPMDGVFLAIGHTPNTEVFKEFLSLDEQKYIKLDSRTQETSIPGVFAAGDVADHRYRQAGTAAGYGIMAALDAVHFLQNIGFNDVFAHTLESSYYDPESEVKVELKRVITDKEVNLLLKDSKPLVIEVGAEWCAACKVLLPVVQSVAAKLSDKINFAQIDLDDNPKDLQKRFGLEKIPSLLILKDNKVVSRYDGKVFSRKELFDLLNNL